MKRVRGWEQRLNDYLEQCRDRPFVWAQHDCATMAVGGIEAVRGERIWTPPYDDARSALRYMAESTIESVVDAYLPRVPQAFAQRGDIVLLRLDDRDTLGVCCGSEAAAPGTDGMVLLPMSLATIAWRV